MMPRIRAAADQGLVVATHGRHYVVRADSGTLLQCFVRGKKCELAVGDEVKLMHTAPGQGLIIEIIARRTLLYRSDRHRLKLCAANLNRMMIVLATEPKFSEDLLSRALVAAEAAGIVPLIVLNKIDLSAALEESRARLEQYRKLGYTVLEISAIADAAATAALLAPTLAGNLTLLLGPSGVGKSTLINLLVPAAQAATREISAALNSGRHTTTLSRLYPLPDSGALIDSPGFQTFGLSHLTEGMLERAFPEFRPLLSQCRFYNCHHLHEPDCAILNAVHDSRISCERHGLYKQLISETC